MSSLPFVQTIVAVFPSQVGQACANAAGNVVVVTHTVDDDESINAVAVTTTIPNVRMF